MGKQQNIANDLKLDLADARAECADTIKSVIRQFKAVQNERDNLLVEVKQLRSGKAVGSAYRDELDAVKEQLRTSEALNEQLLSENDERERVTAELEVIKEQLLQSDVAYVRLRSEHGKVKTSKAELKKENEQHQEDGSKISILESQKAETMKAIDQLSRDLKVLSDQAANVEAEIEDAMKTNPRLSKDNTDAANIRLLHHENVGLTAYLDTVWKENTEFLLKAKSLEDELDESRADNEILAKRIIDVTSQRESQKGANALVCGLLRDARNSLPPVDVRCKDVTIAERVTTLVKERNDLHRKNLDMDNEIVEAWRTLPPAQGTTHIPPTLADAIYYCNEARESALTTITALRAEIAEAWNGVHELLATNATAIDTLKKNERQIHLHELSNDSMQDRLQVVRVQRANYVHQIELYTNELAEGAVARSELVAQLDALTDDHRTWTNLLQSGRHSKFYEALLARTHEYEAQAVRFHQEKVEMDEKNTEVLKFAQDAQNNMLAHRDEIIALRQLVEEQAYEIAESKIICPVPSLGIVFDHLADEVIGKVPDDLEQL